MKETIYTIPINEIFEKKCGCPLCELEKTRESAALEYITGAAMMEPDVRIETNRTGFCAAHYADMLKLQNKLSIALMLESHMAEVDKRIFGSSVFASSGEKAASAAHKTNESCFVCGRVETQMKHILKNIAYMWSSSVDFRLLFEKQQYFCLPHLSEMVETARHELNKKELRDFSASAAKLSRAYFTSLRGDIVAFKQSFDYRNNGEPLTDEVKSAVERAITFLTSAKEK